MLLLIVIFILLPLAIGMVWRAYRDIRELYLYFTVKPFTTFLHHKQPLTDREVKSVLEKFFRYYVLLDIALKQEFIDRVIYFLKEKQFEGRQGLHITREIKVLIAASAVQLTLGLQRVSFPHFHTIVVYPGFFRLGSKKSQAVGAVRSDGTILFSLKHFISGYLHSDDAYNVGLHEMAHALKLENAIPNKEFNLIEDQSLGEWFRQSSEELKKIKRKESEFLRSYAATNSMEFFAVSIEYFFEKSEEFKRQLPELYQTLVKMLGQDPSKLLRHS